MATRTSKAQKMYRLIEQWEQSNQSQQLFCEQNNINYKTFLYWRKHYRQKEQAVSGPSFIPLKIEPISSSVYAELIFTNGSRLLFHSSVDATYLKTLIH